MSRPYPEHRQAQIAIVGIAGRFPGAPTIKKFWQNLTAGLESIAFASDEELSAAGVDPALIADPHYVRARSVIDDPALFDAAFFGFSAREAEIIDPQQRIFLECAWEALEDAACDPQTYPGAIGVFAGAGLNTYGLTNLLSNPQLLESVGAYQVMVGNDKDFLCSRVSYKLNLRGPSVGVQTACSTSLVAVQMACESLLRNDCDVALAGGVSIQLPQGVGYLYVPGMIMSRDGHCRAFDAVSSGTVPGSGAGIAVLKRLDDAIADGDHIYAVIQGAAVNNDGSAKAGYSAPSVEGQCAVIRKSMQMAGFDPQSVRYVEAHGTGTEVGDPIEVAALSQAFETETVSQQFCALGSVKTNIGHLDTAAGITGLIKTALCLNHRMIPPTLHFKEANPLIDFEKSPFYVNAALVDYNRPEPFRAGVSSFGIGGTNAHVSLEEAPAVHSDPSSGPLLVVLSAKSAAALDVHSARLLTFLDENPSSNLADVAFTLQKGRQAFQHRRVWVARDLEQLKASLQQPTSQSSQQLRSDNVPSDPAQVAFLFPGQGAQYVNMGRDLYLTTPAFRETVDLCCDILSTHLVFDLREILYPTPGKEPEAARHLNQTATTQPAIFVIEYAMAKLWMESGVHPVTMVGHSVGEYVAACIAGVFSLEDALALIAARGRLIQAMPAGAMLAVNLSEQDLEPLLTSEISVGAVNSPAQVVASGPETAIAALEAKLRDIKIECKRLRTSHAFHSPMMDPIVKEFIQRVSKITLHAPRVRYMSNVTGTWITDAQATSAGYWGSHLRNTVRFADCAEKLLRELGYILLEVGPGETLSALVRQQLQPRSTRALIPSMRHSLASQDDREYWLTAVGRLWLLNARPNWDSLYGGERRARVSLPTYPFERQRYWVEANKMNAAAKPATLAKRPNISDWFYVPSWKRTQAELLLKSEIDGNQTWLFLSENTQLFVQLSATLRNHGNVVQVRAGATFRRLSKDCYELNPGDKSGYDRLMQELLISGHWPDRIIHAWMPHAEELHLDAALNRGIFSAMFLIQAAEEVSQSRKIELNVIGDRTYSILGETVLSPGTCALNAFCGVLSFECPNVSYRAIDLDLNADHEMLIRQLAKELLSAPANEIVAYRGLARWVRQFDQVQLPAQADSNKNDRRISIRTAGAYLITGGLGGIGLVLAQHLARTANARIILTSRTGLPGRSEWSTLLESSLTPERLKRKIRGVQTIEALGGQVLVVEADTTDLAAMRTVLSNLRGTHGPIHGIIHAAGIAGTSMVLTKSREQALNVLAPKVQGVAWLREILTTPELDFILLCSSISAVMPSFGVSDYAGANAYLDGFAAAFDNPGGTRVLSVNWDTWRDVGMAFELELPAALSHLKEEGLQHGIRSAESEEIFDRLMLCPLSQVLISTRDMDALQKQAAATTSDGGSRAMSHKAVVNTHHRSDDLKNFTAPQDEVERSIVTIWQDLLGVEPIGTNDDFFKLGGHSLLGTQVLGRIRERFNVDLSLRTIFEAATPAELAQHVRVLSWVANPAASTSAREEVEL